MWTLKQYNNINELLTDKPNYNNKIYIINNDKSEEIINMINKGYKYSEICDKLKISTKTYYKYIDILNISKINKQRKNKEELYNKILELYGTMSNKEIINKLNISTSLFYKILKKK
jgi:transposase